MSQDNIRCAKCKNLCGYDDNKGYWDGEDLAICSQCKTNLIRRACAFFGMQGASSDNSGMIIDWIDLDRILSKVKKDYCMRVSYLVTDRELYERTKTTTTSILEE